MSKNETVQYNKTLLGVNEAENLNCFHTLHLNVSLHLALLRRDNINKICAVMKEI